MQTGKQWVLRKASKRKATGHLDRQSDDLMTFRQANRRTFKQQI